MEVLLAALCEAIFGVIIGDLSERPHLAGVRSYLTGQDPQKIALQRAFAAAYVDFSERYPELANAFFDEHFLKNREVVVQLSKLLTPSQEPDLSTLETLWRMQFHNEQHIDLRQPLGFFLWRVAEEIKVQPRLRSFVDSRALGTLHDIALRSETQTNFQQEMVSLLQEMRDLLKRGDANTAQVKTNLFQKQVFDVLKLLPGITIQRPGALRGRDVFALCMVQDLIGGSSIVAFECSDNSHPLSRGEVNAILDSFSDNFRRREIDRLCLITRNGLHPDAVGAFDGQHTQQITYQDLLGRLIESHTLIQNMKRMFEVDGLSEYYVATRCYSLDIPWVAENYHLVYNSFMDFALSSRSTTLPETAARWAKYASGDTTHEQYTEKLFEKARQARVAKDLGQLERLVLAWAEDESVQQALAILGSYGTGKSSFAKRLAHIWARKYEDGVTDRMPLLIELRNFGSHQDIRGLITHELINRHGTRHGSYESFEMLNREGKFLLILDGFDEMKQGLSKDVIAYNFNELNKLYSPSSKIVLCGRPTVFSNENEQTSILRGTSEIGFTHAVQYIQVSVAPFTESDIFKFLNKYIRAKHPKEKNDLLGLVRDLEGELPTNNDLKSLLSRPVHLPMLVAVLPEWRSGIDNLKRASLYETFINKTISREIMKGGPLSDATYDTGTRRQFASELALLMFRSGESRSLHFSDIPDDLIRRFAKPGRSLDSTKRDLIAACFLERKPPDILFFGHKSFAEFLLAENLVRLMGEATPNTNTLGIRFSSEVISFVSETASQSNWKNLAMYPVENSRLLDSVLDLLVHTPTSDLPFSWNNLRSALETDDVIVAWGSSVNNLRASTVYRLVAYLTETFKNRSVYTPTCEHLLQNLIYHRDYLVGVHAYRALAAKNLITISELISKIGVQEFERWKAMRWIPDEQDQD